MQAKGKVRFATVPFPKIIRGEARDHPLIDGNCAVRKKGLCEGKIRGGPSEEKSGLRELLTRLSQEAPMLGLPR